MGSYSSGPQVTTSNRQSPNCNDPISLFCTPHDNGTQGIAIDIVNSLTIINKRFPSTEKDTMKSILALVTAAVVAVTEIGIAAASTNLDARSLSLTSADVPTFSSTTYYTPTLTSSGSSYVSSSSSDTATASSSGSDTSTTSHSAPTISTTPFANVTSAGTATQTLGGITHSATISGSLTQTPSTSSTSSSTSNAAASPAKSRVAVMAGIFGVLVAL